MSTLRHKLASRAGETPAGAKATGTPDAFRDIGVPVCHLRNTVGVWDATSEVLTAQHRDCQPSPRGEGATCEPRASWDAPGAQCKENRYLLAVTQASAASVESGRRHNSPTVEDDGSGLGAPRGSAFAEGRGPVSTQTRPGGLPPGDVCSSSQSAQQNHLERCADNA